MDDVNFSTNTSTSTRQHHSHAKLIETQCSSRTGDVLMSIYRQTLRLATGVLTGHSQLN